MKNINKSPLGHELLKALGCLENILGKKWDTGERVQENLES